MYASVQHALQPGLVSQSETFYRKRVAFRNLDSAANRRPMPRDSRRIGFVCLCHRICFALCQADSHGQLCMYGSQCLYFSVAVSSRACDLAALFLYYATLVFHADSMPRTVSPSISLPSAHLLDSSSVNSASRWWSGIVPIPSVAAGSIVRLRFQCPGFQAPGDSLKVYDHGDTLTSSVICSPCSTAASVTTCVVQGPSKV